MESNKCVNNSVPTIEWRRFLGKFQVSARSQDKTYSSTPIGNFASRYPLPKLLLRAIYGQITGIRLSVSYPGGNPCAVAILGRGIHARLRHTQRRVIGDWPETSFHPPLTIQWLLYGITWISNRLQATSDFFDKPISGMCGDQMPLSAAILHLCYQFNSPSVRFHRAQFANRDNL